MAQQKQLGKDAAEFLDHLQEINGTQFAQRLSIYQIEHEMQQIIWNASQAESWRSPHLAHRMDGHVEALFREIAT